MPTPINKEKEPDEPFIWNGLGSQVFVPDEMMPIVSLATSLGLESISDAKSKKHDNNWMEAVDWLFYSKDNAIWSLGYILGILGQFNSGFASSAQARIEMLRDPVLLASKESYDQLIAEFHYQPPRTWLPLHQEDLMFGT